LLIFIYTNNPCPEICILHKTVSATFYQKSSDMPGVKTLIPVVLLLLLGVASYLYFGSSETEQEKDLTTVVKPGEFVITVSATGELNAKRSVKVRGPQGMRAAGIYQTTIAELVPEGTIIEKGDFVGSLDRTELANKMSTIQTELDKIQTQLQQAKIDTAIEMRGLRDEIINLEFSKKEKLLNLEQSKYEPQSVIQQAELDLERTERDYKQLLRKYELKEEQSEAKIEEIMTLLRQNQLQLNILQELSDGFRITAPEDGMLIYARTWNGKKEPGSQISAWDPVVAELPDLSDMISTTYVNEVDISGVEKGQEVKIQIDAFPDKTYSGRVIKVANIGEQLRGYDAKVFEVVVQVNEVDSIMRPAMTTSNEIVTNVYDEIISVPLEALHSDSLPFVYKRQAGAIVRQEVITGPSNDVGIIIDHGLEKGDEVFLAVPTNTENLEFVPIDQAIKEKILAEQEADARRRKAEAMERRKEVSDIEPPSSSSGDGGGVIIIR